jgi:hypothetical protein
MLKFVGETGPGLYFQNGFTDASALAGMHTPVTSVCRRNLVHAVNQ